MIRPFFDIVEKNTTVSITMPPRWSRKPDRADPEFRKLDDRMTFATHVAAFSAVNSGLWFFRVLGSSSELATPGGVPGTPWITGIWAIGLLAHALFIFAIAKYPTGTAATISASGSGFQPKSKEKPKKSVKK